MRKITSLGVTLLHTLALFGCGNKELGNLFLIKKQIINFKEIRKNTLFAKSYVVDETNLLPFKISNELVTARDVQSEAVLLKHHQSLPLLLFQTRCY